MFVGCPNMYIVMFVDVEDVTRSCGEYDVFIIPIMCARFC